MDKNSFKFSCPHCGQHIEVDCDMIGMGVDCPTCGKPFTVPEMETHRPAPVITVIKKRESFIARCKNLVKAIGIGLVVLLLFVGVGSMISETEIEKSDVEVKYDAVKDSIECLLDYIEVSNDRRLQVLSNSLSPCPADYQDAVKEFLIAASQTVDDVITETERNEAMAGSVVLGLLAGAVSDSPQDAFIAGGQVGNLMWEETQRRAQKRLRQQIETKRTHLINVAQKYGINAIKLENALMSKGL